MKAPYAPSEFSNADDQAVRAKILIVDDRPENLLALEAILEPLGNQKGFELVRANSGAEALKQLLQHDFALILLDVQMPGLDGFETAALVKERTRSRHIPIIFITAISKDQKYIFQGYTAGAVDYISKPFDADILKSKVAVFVELFQRGQQLQRQAELLHRIEQREVERQAIERERQLERKHIAELSASQASLARFKSTLDATLDCVLIFDVQTLRFSYVNQGALNQFGFSRSDFMAMKLEDIEEDFDEPGFRAMIDPLIAGKQASLIFEKIVQRRTGETFPVEVFLQYVSSPDESDRFVAIMRDISERKRTEAALIATREEAERARDEAEAARETAEAASRAKSEFISGVSHELRTPLNAIIGFSKLLLNPRIGPLNEDQDAYVQDVVHSAEHLLQLINDILDLSKIEAGKLELDCAPLCLADILTGTLSIVREKARAHNLNLSIELAPEILELPPVVADARKLKQILFNLLSNAAKFTPDGGAISVRARLEKSAEETDMAVVSVQDTGVGIPPDQQQRIFGAFEQVDSSYSKKQQGTGLGLAITKRMVEMHGGQLTVESTPGEGSTFSFSLPVVVEDESTPEGTSTPDASTPEHASAPEALAVAVGS